tara:strand:+ start:3529 stop:3834 length:306 start_codon:yes stop_codon:yes gene_type:complete
MPHITEGDNTPLQLAKTYEGMQHQARVMLTAAYDGVEPDINEWVNLTDKAAGCQVEKDSFDLMYHTYFGSGTLRIRHEAYLDTVRMLETTLRNRSLSYGTH